MAAHGVNRLYLKALAPNDNSKNQPYLGGDFGVLNTIPSKSLVAGTTSSEHPETFFRAPLDLSWLGSDGSTRPAPEAKLILYPQYPEVRFSGYLTGVDKSHRPSDALGTTRTEGRVLLLGVTPDGRVIGAAARENTPLASECLALEGLESVGVFKRVPMGAVTARDERVRLLRALCDIANRGWIASRRLDSRGDSLDCRAPNCGGYTLEAELGITPNGTAAPDFLGWEVKQHGVGKLERPQDSPITLMTPEPNGGMYAQEGVLPFLERYGYPDKKGRADRLNFGGIYRNERVDRTTSLRMELQGYDLTTARITDSSGGICLVDPQDRTAALWKFDGLLAHWRKKHALAVYVPSESREAPQRQYRFGASVRLGTGTSFERFLSAIVDGAVYLDPAVKAEQYPERPVIKRRNQFRVKSSQIARLYHTLESVNACAAAG